MSISFPPLKGLGRIVLLPVVSLLLIPAFTALFTGYATSQMDQRMVGNALNQIAADTSATDDEKASFTRFLTTHSPSSVCFSQNPALATYRGHACARWSTVWQFALARRTAFALLGFGAFVLGSIVLLGGLAFRGRAALYHSLVTGWHLLSVAMAAEAIAQGTLTVWLAFWVTAFFWHSYFIKLIVVAGLFAFAIVATTVAAIFRRPQYDNEVEGELVDRATSPRLWANIESLAKDLGTAPPDQVIAGIDVNFFVTQSPLRVGKREVRGRTLFLSVPLLRVLERHEAGAVLVHELAHLKGGDAASSAALGPTLLRFDQYLGMMGGNWMTRPVGYVMHLFRLALEIAMKRDSRAREFSADRAAAQQVSGQAVVRALVKISAYAAYREQVQRTLFSQEKVHTQSLGIATTVASGLAPFAASSHFLDAVRQANVPHPFDSHPPLRERMQNVGYSLEESGFGAIVAQAPQDHWANDIDDATQIEQRLWADFDRRFAEIHERNLAFRYRPADDAERVVVLKYFPPLAFALKKQRKITITYEGLKLPGEAALVPWDDVKTLKYEDSGDKLEIVRRERGLLGNKSTKITLSGIDKERARFKAAIGLYLHRHRTMREYTGTAAPVS